MTTRWGNQRVMGSSGKEQYIYIYIIITRFAKNVTLRGIPTNGAIGRDERGAPGLTTNVARTPKECCFSCDAHSQHALGFGS